LPNGSHSRNRREMVEELVQAVRSGVILKMGSRGAALATRDGLRQQVEAFRVNAVDTTAAGDAFNGAFTVGLLMGMTSIEGAKFAAAAAAVSVTRAGAQASMATMEEVKSLLCRS